MIFECDPTEGADEQATEWLRKRTHLSTLDHSGLDQLFGFCREPTVGPDAMRRSVPAKRQRRLSLLRQQSGETIVTD